MKKVLGMILFFALGFGTHMWLVRDKIPPMDAGSILKRNVLGEKTEANNFISNVDFDGENFSPKSINVVVGNYLTITNKSKDRLMWLSSDNDKLATTRGFGEGERLMVVMSEKGSFRVVGNEYSKNSLVVFVE